jgi:hypothetical protein
VRVFNAIEAAAASRPRGKEARNMHGGSFVLLGLAVAMPSVGGQARAAEIRWEAPAESGAARLVVAGRPVLEFLEMIAPEDAEAFTLDRTTDVIQMTGRFPVNGQGPGAQIRLKHRLAEPKHLWMPHLAPADGYVMGDHAFRSPTLIVADDQVALALIPDVEDVGAGFKAGWRSWMDYDHTKHEITFCAGNYSTEGHVFYRSEPVLYAGQPVRLRIHILASTDPADVANPYGLATRWMWRRWGAPRHATGGAQRAPLTKYCEYTTQWAFTDDGWGETVWQEFDIDGRRCGAAAFIVWVLQHPSVPMEKREWLEPLTIWNQAWFSTQRCANGLRRYARRIGSKDLERRARLGTNLALSAPQKDGLFPSVYITAQQDWPTRTLYKDTPGWDRARWVNSNRRPPRASEHAIHILDAAFTARNLLAWSELAGSDDEADAYVKRFVDRLLRLQRPSGAFPGWIEPDGRIVDILVEGPESAMGATLLCEMIDRFGDRPEWKQAAQRTLAFLENDPVTTGRWEDYETYYSCNRWGTEDLVGKRVPRNGVYKQNNLSPFWCAEAFLAAYRLWGNERYLALGRRCLDELSLFQQVWDPPYIPAPCHGGFGVMNADGEWNDARQSLFAPLYLEYYKTTGVPEYFERGVAALRASFAMMYCPENAQVREQYEKRHPMFGPESYGFEMENIAHVGPAPPDGSAIGPFTCYSWGNGGALATAALVYDRYGDVYVDPARGHAFGIDGCVATVAGGRVRIEDRYARSSLTVAYADGTRRDVKLSDGRAEVPLRP